jgi:hypothetical protein
MSPRPACTNTPGPPASCAGPRRASAHRAAGDELHRDEHLPGVHADVVDRDDVGVRELGERLGLAQQQRLAAAGAVAVDLAYISLMATLRSSSGS